jgi:hypothetical protein
VPLVNYWNLLRIYLAADLSGLKTTEKVTAASKFAIAASEFASDCFSTPIGRIVALKYLMEAVAMAKKRLAYLNLDSYEHELAALVPSKEEVSIGFSSVYQQQFWVYDYNALMLVKVEKAGHLVLKTELKSCAEAI